MFEIERVTLPELTGDEERNVFIYIPDSFERHPELRYPVLYMFDGQNLFFDEDAYAGKCWGIREYLDYSQLPLMVVGIESNQHPDNSRLVEYTPYSYNDPYYGPIEGKAGLTMEWLVNELKPYIDENYPTLADRRHTLIAGSSMGGLISYYAIIHYNEIFSKAACLSPSLWTNRIQLMQDTKNAALDKDTIVYMDYGSEEDRGRFGQRAVKAFWDLTLKLQRKKVFVTSRIAPFGIHSEGSWEKQVPVFLTVLLDGLLSEEYSNYIIEDENEENNFETEEFENEINNEEYYEEENENSSEE